jgi:hypothetical protein
MTDSVRPAELQDITWVHVFEQDTAAGAVFRRADADIPLSRRPRLRFQLHRDGSAEIAIGGADDRPTARPAQWTEEDGDVVVRSAEGSETLRIVAQSVERLLVRISQRSNAS